MMTSRRVFLRNGTLGLAGLGMGSVLAADSPAAPSLRLGLMTDLHYADKEANRTRFYRETLGKLDEAVAYFNREKLDLVVELGDFIDQADSVELETEWLKTLEQHYAGLSMPRHYVLGNHCVGTLNKQEFAAHTGSTGGHGVVQKNGLTLLLLDACYREDGVPYERANFHWRDANFPRHELDWIRSELDKAEGPVVILTHQRLDITEMYSVNNAAEARKLFESSGKVAAVFQGHSHKNDYQEIGGIHYTTLAGMIEGSGRENSAYAILDILPDTSLRLHGFHQQAARDF